MLFKYFTSIRIFLKTPPKALLLMVNHKSPLEACDPPTLAKINESPGVREFLEHCFNRNQSERASASQLLTHPIFNGI